MNKVMVCSKCDWRLRENDVHSKASVTRVLSCPNCGRDTNHTPGVTVNEVTPPRGKTAMDWLDPDERVDGVKWLS